MKQHTDQRTARCGGGDGVVSGLSIYRSSRNIATSSGDLRSRVPQQAYDRQIMMIREDVAADGIGRKDDKYFFFCNKSRVLC